MGIGPYEIGWDSSNAGIYTGSCIELAAEIPNESVDLIMTDPPWDDAEWFNWLGGIGLRVLRPGGSLFSMCGKAELDKVMFQLSEHLTYNWMCAGYQPQSNLQFMPRRIMEKWRPAVWYTKGKRKQAKFISDLKSTNRDKRYHSWGQGESFFLYYMDKIGGDIVFEPFVGGGTTLAVAKTLGKHAFGFEIDGEQAMIARKRVVEANIPLPIEFTEQSVLWEK